MKQFRIKNTRETEKRDNLDVSRGTICIFP
ncbi:hypothetical protein UACE39S_06105 [Ureibacillus acetophenoni]